MDELKAAKVDVIVIFGYPAAVAAFASCCCWPSFHDARRRLRLVKGRHSEQIWAGTDYLANIG